MKIQFQLSSRNSADLWAVESLQKLVFKEQFLFNASYYQNSLILLCVQFWQYFFSGLLIGKEYETKYKLALQLLSSQHLSSQTHETEFSIVQSIKKLLGTKERYQDARKFDELYARLTASVSDNHKFKFYLDINCLHPLQSILKNRKAVLELMYYLALNPPSAANEPVVRHSFTLPSLASFTTDVGLSFKKEILHT